MTPKFSLKYLGITLLIILLGIVSRKIGMIPLFIGDILYAVMIYYLIHSLFLLKQKWVKIIIPLTLCFIIELSQLIDVHWLNFIRNTTLGHYILGQGFLFSDLVCYSIGIILSFSVETKGHL